MYICLNMQKIRIEIPDAPCVWAPGVSVDSVGVTLKGHGPAGNTWGINREYVCICGIYVYGRYNKDI